MSLWARVLESVRRAARRRSLAAIEGLEARTTAAFRRRLVELCDRVGLIPDFLAAVIAFESAGTFLPDVRNPRTGATGLIQFLPSTAIALGTTTAELASMTAEEQLDPVERYFRAWVTALGRPLTLEDHYLLVLAGKRAPPDGVLFADTPAAGDAYDRNRGLDVDGDGKITAPEAASRVRARLDTARGKPRIPVDVE